MPRVTQTGETDEKLVRQVVDGDGDAFTAIVRRYQDRLYSTLYRLVGSPEDARDLLQEAFVKAYRHLDRFEGASSLYTWLYRIAVNTGLSHRRKRKRVYLSLSEPFEEDGPGRTWEDPSADDPADPVMSAETEALVQRALDALDGEHRTVVILRDIQQLDYAAIAEILDVPAGTVKSRLHRARLMLRDRLKTLLLE